MTRGRRRRSARRSWAAWLTIPLALLGFGLVIAPPSEVRVHVVVDGRPVALGQPATVGGALTLAGARPRNGHQRTAVSNAKVDDARDPAVITRNGEPARRSDRVHDGDVVRTEDGRDWIEAAVTRTEAVPFAGLPEVETHAWRPGEDGTRRVVVGARSGELIGQTLVTAPVDATAVDGPVVTLSFDDGPHPEWTPQVLDILARRNVRAVFCVVGQQVDANPELVTRIAAEGHRLCDHSVDHANLTGAGEEQLAAEIGPTADRVEALTGERPQFFRSPYGVFSDPVVARAHAVGLRVLGWAVDTEDFQRPTPTALVSEILDAVVPGSVILFHDGGGDRSNTVAALPYVISALQGQGYRFVVPGVAGAPPPEASSSS